MKRSRTYIPTYSDITDRHTEAVKMFKKTKPHKDTFLDVVALEGCFMCDNAEVIYESLQMGEKLTIKQEEGSKFFLPPLLVFRENGEEIGKLPFAQAILPNILIERGISVWCYAEAKRFVNDLLEIAVSLYCENY